MAEIDKLDGKIRIDPLMLTNGFAYVGQESWVKAASIKDNILFGSKMNHDLYKKVIDACALTADLELLPYGDETLVGESGVCLSGGQKARLALARACYAMDKEIFLLDDPFSAVDAHVASHINTNCINDLLSSKTRIICTHHYKYLTNADLVLVFDNGVIVEAGKGEEIIANLPNYIKMFKLNGEKSDSDDMENSNVEKIKKEISKEDLKEKLEEKEIQRQDEEEKEHGIISLKVYKYYCLSIGIFLCVLTLISLSLMQASKNLTDFWLSYWTQHHSSLNSTHRTLIINPSTIHIYTTKPFSNDKYLDSDIQDNDSTFFFMVYGILCGSNSLFTLFRAFLFAYSGILAGKSIHNCLVNSLSQSQLKFFNVTPRGRILNRLSTDMYAVDDSLPFILNIFLASLFGLLGVLVVTCYSLPWFSFSLIPLSIAYYTIQNYYRWTSRELKRLSSLSLSPIYTHFHETISGLVTIRAFRQVNKFSKINESYLNDFIRSEYSSQCTSQWLNFRLQMMSVLMITIVGFTAVLQHIFSTANPSLIGLALSYILSVTNLLNGLLTSFTETEKEMVSVERCQQYRNLEAENWLGIETIESQWPINPNIEFSNVTLR